MDEQVIHQSLEGYKGEVIRSFGRIRNRKLSTIADARLQDFMQTYAIQDFTAITGLLLPSDSGSVKAATSAVYSQLQLEVGFGFGEHLWQQAQRHPESLWVGCETYVNGLANLAELVSKSGDLPNLKIFAEDARKLLVQIPDKAVTDLFLLFPDPWPKTSHWKRRLVNESFCELLARIIRPGGRFIFASDHPDYVHSVHRTLQKFSQEFQLDTQSEMHPTQEPKDWIKTRYQLKSLAGVAQFFIYHRLL